MRIKPPPHTLLIPTIPTTIPIAKTPRPLLLPPPFFFLLPNLNNPRTLTSTAPLLKKGGKQDSKRTVPHNAAIALAHSHSQSGDGNDDPEAPSEAAAIDAFDFTDYKAAIERAHEHLRGQLGTIRAAGGGGGRRGSAEEIEGARVWLGGGGSGGGKGKSGGRGKKEEEGEEGEEARVVKLGDVASVVARGRNVGVLVGEKKVRFFFIYFFLLLSYSLTLTLHEPPHPKEERPLNLKTHQSAPETDPLLPRLPPLHKLHHLAQRPPDHSRRRAPRDHRVAGGGQEAGRPTGRGGAVRAPGGAGRAAEEAPADGVGEAGRAGRAVPGGEGEGEDQ